MTLRPFLTRALALATSGVVALAGIIPSAVAGPGFAPGYSRNANPAGPPDVVEPTFYANSPLGPRPDLVGGANALPIDTGAPMRKFVDILPSVKGLAPTTNAGTGAMAYHNNQGLTGAVDDGSKYIPLAVPGVWPTDLADYYHIAAVEYQEQLHSDLPKASVLRGYVQIEEPGQPQPTGSKHVPLFYPNGTPITLPDAAGVQHQVFGYDQPHYLGPMIVATKDHATRIKYSNLLPPGAATCSGTQPKIGPCQGTVTRNGDLPLPVDATLAGGALPQNRIDIHLHGGLTPWISDGNPHQWTIPVGDTRYGYLTDIAVTATGAGYSASPVVTIAPPQSIATAHAVVDSTTSSLKAIDVVNAGGFYSAANPPVVTVAAPLLRPGVKATASATASGYKVTAVTGTNGGASYTVAPVVTISAPQGTAATASATSTLRTGGTAVQNTTVASLAPAAGGGGSLYNSASLPGVHIAAPTPNADAVPTVTVANGVVTGVSVSANYGYYGAAPALTLSAPPAAVNATASSTLAGQSVSAVALSNTGNFGYFTTPTVTLAPPANAVQATGTPTLGTGAAARTVSSIAVNGTNFGYFTAPTVTVSAPPASSQTTATAVLTGGAVSGITLSNTANFGYFSAPTVTIAPPGTAVTATANATGINAASGAITGLTITGGGSGYTGTTAAVTFPSPPATVQANASGTVSGGALTGVTLTNVGYGYWTAPTVTVSAPPGVPAAGSATVNATTGALTAIIVTSSGVGYTAAPTVTVAAPPATVQATATATLGANGVVSSPLTLTNAGFGYWTAPRVTLSAPPASVRATATVTTGRVVSIANGGTNYATAPTVTVTGGTRTGAGLAWTATATVAGGKVTAITIGNAGTVYSQAPTLTIAAPPAAVTPTATATVANGVITAINVGAGSVYTTVPTVTIAAPTAGTQASARATLTGNVITVALRNAGAGYASAPAITFSAPTGTGVAATATASVANGRISGITVNTGGTGYVAAPTITIGAPTAGTRASANVTIANGLVTGVSATGFVAGTGYDPLATVPAATIAAPAGAGTPATATAIVQNGVLTGFQINGGSGYTSAPTVTLTGGWTASTRATATANIANGKITSISMVNGGTNYTAAPTITIDAPTASVPATATANIANGSITGFTVTNPGSNYTAAPAVTVGAATPSTRATATASVANGVLSIASFTPGSGYVSPPTVTGIPASTPSVAATATAVVTNGAVTGYTVTNAGQGYLAAPAVTIDAPPPAQQATATASVAAGAVSGYTITNSGWGYTSAPTVTVADPYVPAAALASAIVGADGTLRGIKIDPRNPGAGYTPASPPVVTVAPPANARQAVATAKVTAGQLTGVTIVDAGGGYTDTPAVTVSDTTGAGGAINALIAMPVGPGFKQVPDMVGDDPGTLDGTPTGAPKRPAGYTPPAVGEGTLYYTNNQSERLMWYHDHTTGITRLNVYEGLAAPFMLRDPSVEPQLPTETGVATTGGQLQGYLPQQIIPIVIEDKTFVPKDIMLEDARWDQGHWGTYGDLWFPHVYETNQNPAMLASASAAGRWDWGPWFAIVYPSMYSLPSGQYGDVTTTPEAFQDSETVNGVAFPTVTVEPRAYRLEFLNSNNDRFVNLGFYQADPLQARAADGAVNTEVLAGPQTGAQPSSYPGNPFSGNTAVTPWPVDGRWAPNPDQMGPSMFQIGNEGGLLPMWVEQPAIPINMDYNRRSVTVLNVSQDNDVTQACYPKCHGLYIGPAMRADVVVDFAPWAGRTLILYNDNPAPNPGFDGRIDYFTGNDPGNAGNYPTGGAPNTEVGYAPNTRTILQVVVGTKANVDGLHDPAAEYPMAIMSDGSWNPQALGTGRSIGANVGTPGLMQRIYAATQAPPIVGESAYNVIGAVDSTHGFSSNYIDQVGDMYLASQNEPMFFVTNPGALNLISIAVLGKTTATGAASGIGLGGASGGNNPAAGAGTGYWTAPTVRIDPPGCDPLVSGRVGCHTAVATANVAGGQVQTIDLLDPGAGYTEVPAVTLISGGAVSSLSVTNVGSGYTTVPNVTVAPPANSACVGATCPTVTAATATATVSASGSVSIALTSGGSGYSAAPVVTIDPPANLAATGTATVGAGSVTGVTLVSGGVYPAGSATVTFAAPPAPRTAVIQAVPFSGICCSYTILDGGTGYTGAPTLTLIDPTGLGSGATANLVVTNGSVTSVVPTATGNFAYGAVVNAAVSAPTSTVSTATGVATVTNGVVTGVTITNGGSGYLAAPAVTFSGGTQATAVAGVAGGGTGATAMAIASTTRAFVAPAALPNGGVPTPANSVPMTLPSLCPASVTTCPTLDSIKIGRLMNPAIQELFEPFYGRMNATLGIEMPNQSLTVQTTLPLNYIDPATEQLEANTSQMWKITHNGVDTHPVHFHLVNVQVVNRVGWDGTVKPVEDNELGWRETVTMNPLEDIIVVMNAAMPQVPFGIDHSYRAQDPSQPLGVNMGFTQFAVVGLNGTPVNGLPVDSRALGIGEPATVVNSMEEYDNEYVWHCHILGHEENDFMRAIAVTNQTLRPDAPTSVVAVQQPDGTVQLTWVDPTPFSAPATYGNAKNELGFKVERSIDGGATWHLAATAAANATQATDPVPGLKGTAVQYRVYGYNVASAGRLLNADPTSTGVGLYGTTSITLQ